MESSQTYIPIAPTITDDAMLPNAKELSAMSENGESTAEDAKQLSKTYQWPSKIIMIISAVVIVCLIIIFIYCMWRQSTICDPPNSPPPPSKQTRQSHPHHPQQPQQPVYDENNSHQQSVDNQALKKYIKSKKQPSSVQHQQQVAVTSDQKLERIPEETPLKQSDGNDDETRNQFTQQLKAEMKKETANIEDDNVSLGSNDSDESAFNECSYVLISGKRRGEQCNRRCQSDNTVCGRHMNK